MLLFWPLWLLTRRGGRAETVCLFFSLAGFYFWGWLSPMIRYAAGPMAVFAALTGARTARFFDGASLPARAAVLAGAAWAMFLGVCSVMIVEINAPQLLYLSGRIDRARYLRSASVTGPVPRWPTTW